MIEPPIIEHVHISDNKHFPIFSSFFNNFFVIRCVDWKATNVLWMSEVKEQHKKMNDNLLQFNLNPFLVPISYLSWICFEWLKAWWVCQLRL
jgi:hypothetical protein